MERLTFRHDAPYSKFHQKAETCEPINCIDQYSVAALDKVIARLADYEDTGYIPKEVQFLMDAKEQGLVVRLDERTALAIAAGARAIENNKRLFGATYMWDIFSKFGEPKEISYCEAAQILREISEPVLAREAAEKVLEEARHSDKG